MAFINLLEVTHPVGSLWFSTTNTSPASIVGGTWTAIDSAAIRSGSEVGYIGSDTHTLTIDEMPSHEHSINTKSANDVLFTSPGSVGGSGKVAPTDWGDGLVASAAGGSQPHSIVQRSFNCFIWYRVA